MTAKQTNPQKPKARNGKPLMSELLTETRKYIEQAEQADVASLRQFLFNEPNRPLIAMGHGGSHSSAAYAAILYGTNCGLGRAMTPYQANSLSDATLKSAKQLLVSKSLKNQDAVYIAKRMNTVNPEHSFVFHLPPTGECLFIYKREDSSRHISKTSSIVFIYTELDSGQVDIKTQSSPQNH